MLNNFVLIGEIKKIKLKTRDTYILTITNSNSSFTIELPHNIGKNVEYYTKEGDTIGVKGYLNAQENTITLVADRVTFLQNTTKTTHTTTNTNTTTNINKGEI